tara:strand:+ start:1719 stop:2504 length:786 start_codon:yes stop_codon:yes gene_type:complete
MLESRRESVVIGMGAALGLAVLLGLTTGHGKRMTAAAPEQSEQLARQADPTDFSPEELRYLQQRFGVHGPQTKLAQLFTEGVDQLQPLRAQTLERLSILKPVILRESELHNVNPMLITAILFDEIQHSKPGEDLPFIVHSGLVKTHGPAQLGISELIHQGWLPERPSDQDIAWARKLLMEPSANVKLLAGKIKRLKASLGIPEKNMLQASHSYVDAKAIATLAYLHNGKLDYPARIQRYMQDAELHQLIYGTIISKPNWLV